MVPPSQLSDHKSKTIYCDYDTKDASVSDVIQDRPFAKSSDDPINEAKSEYNQMSPHLNGCVIISKIILSEL